MALVVSLLSAYYSWSSNQIAQESNNIAKKIQTETRSLFLAEKRPYLYVEVPQLEGKYLDIQNDGKNLSAKFSIKISNNGGIAARDIKIYAHFFDEEGSNYQNLTIIPPDLQKILPGKFNIVNPTIGSGGNENIYRAIKSGKLMFQVEVIYKSDIEEEAPYTTRVQFLLDEKGVTLLGSLGEFQ